jgi:L-alanine-DL-glutamate epimerase-like enolase superfamily enzyme
VPVKGELAVPQKPGLGLEFDEAALRRYSVKA